MNKVTCFRPMQITCFLLFVLLFLFLTYIHGKMLNSEKLIVCEEMLDKAMPSRYNFTFRITKSLLINLLSSIWWNQLKMFVKVSQ